jgi:subtilisin family serine protease
MATPFVAGLIALIKSAKPQLTGAQIEGLLKRTARDLGTAGEDATYGFGLVDVQAAHALATQLKGSEIAPERGMATYGLSFTDWNGLPED